MNVNLVVLTCKSSKYFKYQLNIWQDSELVLTEVRIYRYFLKVDFHEFSISIICIQHFKYLI